MYNSKHPWTWDEIFPYVQHYYNRALHILTGDNPFEVGLGFQPLCLVDVALDFATTQEELSHVQSEADKSTNFTKHIHHIYQQVHDILEKANAKYKECHDQHQMPHKFQVHDKV